jgi:hypothetical protein
MTIRSRRESVTFRHPFRIHGIERLLPAGRYDLIADEETIEAETFSAWRRIGTTIILPAEQAGDAMQMLSIHVLDLADARRIDASVLND